MKPISDRDVEEKAREFWALGLEMDTRYGRDVRVPWDELSDSATRERILSVAKELLRRERNANALHGRLKKTTEADSFRHVREIVEARERILGLKNEIRKNQTKLIQIVVMVFNEVSRPLNGDTVENREIVLGFAVCTESPIGICVYSEDATSIPAQREAEAWHEAHRGTPEQYRCPASDARRTDACLFCGTVLDPNHEQDGRQLWPKKSPQAGCTHRGMRTL
jgi:hypothetical protein